MFACIFTLGNTEPVFQYFLIGKDCFYIQPNRYCRLPLNYLYLRQFRPQKKAAFAAFFFHELISSKQRIPYVSEPITAGVCAIGRCRRATYPSFLGQSWSACQQEPHADHRGQYSEFFTHFRILRILPKKVCRLSHLNIVKKKAPEAPDNKNSYYGEFNLGNSTRRLRFAYRIFPGDACYRLPPSGQYGCYGRPPSSAPLCTSEALGLFQWERSGETIA